MKGIKKIIVLLLLGTMLVTSMSGCTKPEVKEGDPITIVVWHTLADQHEAAFQKVIDGFNASQTKYVVVAEQQPWNEFDAKLMQATRNGTGPDVTSMWPTTAIQYITEGLLTDFAPFINDPKTGIPGFKESLAPGLYEEITQWGENSIYLFPLTGTGEVLFYNKTMFDELGIPAPKTWSDVEAYSKLIKEKKGIPGFGSDSITDTFLCLIKQAGSDYIDAKNVVINMDRNIAIEKLNWFGDGVKNGYFRLVGDDYYFSNPFGSQAVASYIGSSAGVSYVFAAVGDKFEVGCVPIPQEGPVKYISSWGIGDVCLTKDPEKARGVYEFLKYYRQNEVLIQWGADFGAIPYYLDALKTDQFKDFADTNIAIKALAENLHYAGMLPSILGTAGVRIRLDEMVQKVALGTADAATAFDDFVKAANAELKP